jgi:hypothetical protein
MLEVQHSFSGTQAATASTTSVLHCIVHTTVGASSASTAVHYGVHHCSATLQEALEVRSALVRTGVVAKRPLQVVVTAW